LQRSARGTNERRVIMERHVDEASLAWALALAAKPHLGAVDRNEIYVAIGAGETLEAIRKLVKLVAVERIPVKRDLELGCLSWLRGYVGHEDERSIRGHIDDFVPANSLRILPTAQANHPPTRPRRRHLAPLSSL
jgi:hypothetical protein